MNKRLFAKELVQKRAITKSSVAKHYGCKCARHCGLIAVERIAIFPVKGT